MSTLVGDSISEASTKTESGKTKKRKRQKRRGHLSAKEKGLPGSVDWRRTWPAVWREVPSLWWTLQVLSHLESPPVHSKTSPVNQMRQTWHMYLNSFQNHHLEMVLYNTARTRPFYIITPPPPQKYCTKHNSTKRFQNKPDIQNHHRTTHLFWTMNLWPELQQPHDHLMTEQSGHSCYFRFSSMTCNQQTICFSHIRTSHVNLSMSNLHWNTACSVTGLPDMQANAD